MTAVVILADYQGLKVSFTDDGWFNATQAAARFEKEPAQWMRLPGTLAYLNALQRKYGKNTYLKTRRGAAGGTWLHPKLAVAFARWLDDDFAVWCDDQIDQLIHGKSDWRKLRHESASSYKVMQQILQMRRADEGKTSGPHHFSNEARLVNFALTGKFEGINRDALSGQDLNMLANLEERNAVLIGRGLEYATRKTLLEQYALDWRVAHTPVLGAAA